MKDTVYVQIQAPDWVTVEHFKKATPLLSTILSELKTHGEDAYRGYLHRAALDGFPVTPLAVPKEQLEELVIRAFWFAFERMAKGKRFKSEG